jgi:hypothetical protein
MNSVVFSRLPTSFSCNSFRLKSIRKNTRGTGCKSAVHALRTIMRSASQARVKTLTPLESAPPQNTPITRLESAPTRKGWGGTVNQIGPSDWTTRWAVPAGAGGTQTLRRGHPGSSGRRYSPVAEPKSWNQSNRVFSAVSTAILTIAALRSYRRGAG